MTIAIPPTLRPVKRPGGIVVWRGPRPVDHEGADEFWQMLADSLAANRFDFHRVTGVLCHCGCLLAHANEPCPACLVWAIRDAAKHSWTRAETAARTTQQRRKAA